MKFYIASKFEQKNQVKELFQKIIEAGHSVIYDWTDHIQKKPYSQNQDIVRTYSTEEVQAVLECDVFVLLSAPEKGAGYSTELGVALGSNQLKNTPAIFILGPHLDLNSFFFHPVIKRVDTIEDVLKDITI